MRKRKEIEKSIKAFSETNHYAEVIRLTLRDNIKLELLLDIRELLQDLISGKNLIERQVQEIKMQKIDPKTLKKL